MSACLHLRTVRVVPAARDHAGTSARWAPITHMRSIDGYVLSNPTVPCACVPRRARGQRQPAITRFTGRQTFGVWLPVRIAEFFGSFSPASSRPRQVSRNPNTAHAAGAISMTASELPRPRQAKSPSVSGIWDVGERRDLIAYLETLK